MAELVTILKAIKKQEWRVSHIHVDKDTITFRIKGELEGLEIDETEV